MKSSQKTVFNASYVIGYFIEKKGGINKGCKYVAKQLNRRWVWKHIYNVYKGAKPSKKLERALQLLMKPKIKRWWTKVQADTQEQRDYWNSFTMEERREALDNMRKD